MLIAFHALKQSHTHTEKKNSGLHNRIELCCHDGFLLRERKEIKIYSLRTSDNFNFGAYITLPVVTFYWLKCLKINLHAEETGFHWVCVCVCCDLKCLSHKKYFSFFFFFQMLLLVLVLAENQWNHKSNNSHQNLSHNFHSKYTTICIKLFHYV